MRRFDDIDAPRKTNAEQNSPRSLSPPFCGFAGGSHYQLWTFRTKRRHALRFIRKPCSVITTVGGFRDRRSGRALQQGETRVTERRERRRRTAADDGQSVAGNDWPSSVAMPTNSAKLCLTRISSERRMAMRLHGPFRPGLLVQGRRHPEVNSVAECEMSCFIQNGLYCCAQAARFQQLSANKPIITIARCRHGMDGFSWHVVTRSPRLSDHRST